jgi:hypothetical protein
LIAELAALEITLASSDAVASNESVGIMRSQVIFVMHPTDEAEFVEVVLAEPGIVFVDGPNWTTAQPPTMIDIQNAGNYLMIWRPSETPKLRANHLRKDDEEWWYCSNEHLTIQFLRSGFQYEEPFLFEGRLAVGTTNDHGKPIHAPSTPFVEKRFKTLKRFIQKLYTNNVLIWQCISSPRSKNNPSKPTALTRVGPHALQWLRDDPRKRWVQQSRNSPTRAYVLDLVK